MFTKKALIAVMTLTSVPALAGGFQLATPIAVATSTPTISQPVSSTPIAVATSTPTISQPVSPTPIAVATSTPTISQPISSTPVLNTLGSNTTSVGDSGISGISDSVASSVPIISCGGDQLCTAAYQNAPARRTKLRGFVNRTTANTKSYTTYTSKDTLSSSISIQEAPLLQQSVSSK